MALSTESSPRRLPGITPAARFMDCLGKWIITAGGLGVIVAVLGIFLFVLVESYPLFLPPKVSQVQEIDLDRTVLATGVDQYQKVMFAVHETGIDFYDVAMGSLIKAAAIDGLNERRIVSAYRALNNEQVGLGLEDGVVLMGRLDFQVVFEDGGTQTVTPFFIVDGLISLFDGPVVQLAYRNDGDGRSTVLAMSEAGQLKLGITAEKRGLLGRGKTETVVHDLTAQVTGRATSVAVARSGRYVLAGTDQGEVVRWEVGRPKSKFELMQQVHASGQAITALEFMLGDVSVIVGDAGGQVSTWMPVRIGEGGNDQSFEKVHVLQGHAGAVTVLTASARDKQFLSGDDMGHVAVHHMTSKQTFFSLHHSEVAISALAFLPKLDGFVTAGHNGAVRLYDFYNPHPEITLQTLFGKVWYEGYAQPEYVWQSTGGTDEFEPKMSIVPLLFGTLKGTFYAMLFALPLAVLAAIYTSEFASATVRNWVKPIVELMASLPSVILGFLAGLWLAPLLEKEVVGALLLLPLVSTVVILCSWFWTLLPEDFARQVPDYLILTLLGGVTLVALWLSFVLGPVVESVVFGGHFQKWLLESAETRYDQRNCLVVGFAMGFAVVPIIYTICEDALSSVPSHLRAGSLALGATPWQTAVRVVLPTASPGIFSATMIGFGRAVGETMIVLMATGNTPITDWSVFNGMRTLSANIAVEIPEAPHEGTLYRILFLTGLLLAALTFFVNTVAEVVRQRLRERYSRI
ncbi:MAG: ABC transporter permease subunit [Candidatus Latescibacteria bacterium]|nr:ABC transporter permease subunit [Candidatus Latescibacterota bacterium]